MGDPERIKSVRNIDRRLNDLGRALVPKGDNVQLIFYDPATGEPLTQIDPGARVLVWMPPNGREMAHNGA